MSSRFELPFLIQTSCTVIQIHTLTNKDREESFMCNVSRKMKKCAKMHARGNEFTYKETVIICFYLRYVLYEYHVLWPRKMVIPAGQEQKYYLLIPRIIP